MKNQPNISIVDYGVGNLHSVVKAFRRFTGNVIISEEPEIIRSSDAIILPGVGSFASGMKGLLVRGLQDVIREFAESGKPVLGICLGAQLFFRKGFEFGEYDGLGILDGSVVFFSGLEGKTKIPHIGWNTIYHPHAAAWDGTILDGLKEKSYAYFVHSYIMEPSDQEHILASSLYGGREFVAVVKKGNVYGCQFHPEKSGEVGLRIINNFINSIS